MKRDPTTRGENILPAPPTERGDSYPSSAGGGDVVVAALVAELDAMLAQVRHAA